MKNNKEVLDVVRRTDDLPDLTRRKFMKVVGVFTLSGSAGTLLSCDEAPKMNGSGGAAKGYILVDSAKCMGCLTCMISCSLAHEGGVDLSLARLQITQNPFAGFPSDTVINQCYQCRNPACLNACPAGAIYIDSNNGNLRLIDKERCVGCGACIEACPFETKRPIVAPDEDFGGARKSRKCDLCLNAPYHFHDNGGGVSGIQTCAAVCPVDAIQFSVRVQGSNYDVNLRNETWGELGFSTS